MPSLGMTSAGTTVQSSRLADHVMNRAKAIEAALHRRDGTTWKEVSRALAPIADPDFQFVFLDGGYGLLELNSSKILRFAG